MSTGQTETILQPKIIRGQVGSLSIFEITDYELDALERGGDDGIYLNIAISLLSVAVSFFVTIVTVDFSSTFVGNIFFIFTIAGFAAGAVLIFIWNKSRVRASQIVSKIKARVPAVSSDDEIEVIAIIDSQ